MRILVLCNLYPPHAYGGYELACADVVDRWRQRGHDVLVLTSDVVLDAVETPEEDASRVRRRLRLFWRDHVILNPSPLGRLRTWRHNRRCLDDAVDDFAPEVASAWAMGAMSLGLLSRLGERSVPVVSVVCDEWPVYGPKMDSWLRPFLERRRLGRAVRLATGLDTSLPDLDDLGPTCFASEAMRKKIRSLSSWRFPFSGVVPLGIDSDVFRPSADRAARPWRWRILHVGRIDERKGIATVIEALARCPEQATLEVLGRGDDDYLGVLRATARSLGVAERVTFGECDRRALADRYRQADAVVFAPLWDEPFGLVPLESMGCGTPVVASPTGGAVEFLTDQVNCLTFPPGDAVALAAALGRLADDTALRRTIVSGGDATASRYTAERLTSDLERWNEAAVNRSGPPSNH